MIFKIGDKVKILPSAAALGVKESEVGTTQTILRIESLYDIVITDSDDGEWWVNKENITLAIKVGQQLLLWEWV